MTGKTILNRIDESLQKQAKLENRRSHLGASVIGQECDRKTWYGFRWVLEEKFSGRMLRLFSRGHFEEPRFVKYLEDVGFNVLAEGSDGKQFRISDIMGHFGGSCDGKATFPEYFPNLPPPDQFDPAEEVLLEFKTSSTKYFPQLKAQGVRAYKPQHAAQMDTYGMKMGLRWAIYMCVDKNTDDLYVEFVKLDWSNGQRMIDIAEGLITSNTPPKRAFPKSHFKCNFCNFKRVCHYDEPMEKNCRSCKKATAAPDGEWFCNLYSKNIPKDFIAKGCSAWAQLDNI